MLLKASALFYDLEPDDVHLNGVPSVIDGPCFLHRPLRPVTFCMDTVLGLTELVIRYLPASHVLCMCFAFASHVLRGLLPQTTAESRP